MRSNPTRKEVDDTTTMPFVFCLVLALCCFVITSPAFAKGDLDAKQARKLIAHTPGLGLKTSAVRVKTIRSVDNSTFEVTAEIATAFRFESKGPGRWRVMEFRTGQDQWQSLEFVFSVLKIVQNESPCDGAELAVAEKTSTDPSVKRARCVLADLLGVQLPSDDVRIKAVSPMALPFSSKPSALVEAFIAAGFRLQRGANGSWYVAEVKTGNRNWTNPETILAAVNDAKATTARAELESIANALKEFRKKQGFYVESKSEAVLIDFLSPTYLSRAIRLDPWGRPYKYEGTRDHFTLLSVGPDGKENTGDDINLIGPTSMIHPPNSR